MKVAAPADTFEEPIMRRRTALTALCALAVAGTLAGCASFNSVAVDVSSQGEWPADRKPGSYAIERLPSQQANAAEQERIEAAALPALEGAGFTQAPIDQADYLIQVGARAFEVPGGYGYYASPFYWRTDYWMYGYHRPFFYGPYWGPYYYYDSFPDYRRETAILIRDRRSQRIVYETRATHVSRWTSDGLLPVLFDASMKDFPLPAISPRTVKMPLPPGS